MNRTLRLPRKKYRARQWAAIEPMAVISTTAVITTMVLFQALHVGNARAVRRSVWQLSPFSNRFLLIGTVVSLAIHVAAIYLPPTQWLLRFEPVDFSAWIRMVAVAFSVIVVVEADKVLRRWRGVNRSGTG